MINELLLLPFWVAFVYLSGLYCSLSSPNKWDDCFGEADQSDNWCLKMRKSAAADSASVYFKSYFDQINSATTEEGCDKIINRISYGNVVDEYELMAYRNEYERLSETVANRKMQIIRLPEIARQEKAFQTILISEKNEQWSNIVELCSIEISRQKNERGAVASDAIRFDEYKDKAIGQIKEIIRSHETNRIQFVRIKVEQLICRRNFLEARAICKVELEEVGKREGSELEDKKIWHKYSSEIDRAIEHEIKERECAERKKLEEDKAEIRKKFTMAKKDVNVKKLYDEVKFAKDKYGENDIHYIAARLKIVINVTLVINKVMVERHLEFENKLRSCQYEVFNLQYDSNCKLQALSICNIDRIGEMRTGLNDGTFMYPLWLPKSDAEAIWEHYYHQAMSQCETSMKNTEALIDDLLLKFINASKRK